MSNKTLYATPRLVSDIKECNFYHVMDIPGYGPVEGEFDLRGKESKYLGNVDFKGKRVLEVGPASGYLSFYMERQGADVVAFDLNEDYSWDVVPFAGYDYRSLLTEFKGDLRKLNDGFWLCHRVFNSKVKVVYGTVYDIPKEIGEVDVATFCAVLPHFKDPFGALHGALSLTKEKVIVTDIVWNRYLPCYLQSLLSRPQMLFVPEYEKFKFPDSWWFLPPSLVRSYLGVLGFRTTKTNYFIQKYKGRPYLAYSLVGERTLEDR